MIVLIVVIVLLLLVALYVGMTYNRLIALRNRCENAWSQVDVQLKRRYDLVPNLVEAVKGYATHESAVFREVTEARAAAQGAQTVAEQAGAERALTGAIGRLFAVAEAYPELRASENFRQLQQELTETENKIAISRQVYNDTVQTYNTKVESFPSNLIAGPFNFQKRTFFELDDAAAAEPPKVAF